jgi:NUDIX domain
MVASAFLPVALVQNELVFLFGKEAADDSAPGFSDFGGGVETNENIYEAGLREMAEETTGFFGNAKDIKKLVNQNGGVYKMQHNDYHIHIFKLDYDPKLPVYYNNSHKFVYDRLDHKYLKKTMIFEKIEIRWMTVPDMKKYKSKFRKFYQEIVTKIIQEESKIKHFLTR